MKAVLVIDMPCDCYDCPLCKDSVVDRCNIMYRDIHSDGGIEETDGRPLWCPLRPLPSEKYLSLKDKHDDIIFQMGWNACLDEITGETE